MFNRSQGAWHEIPVPPAWGALNSISWAGNANGFYVVSWLPASHNLLYVTPTGKVRLLLRNSLGHRMLTPLLSPDGKHLAFTAETWDSNAWLLENF